MAAHDDATKARLNGERTKLAGLEPGVDRYRPIMKRDRIPAEEPARGRQEGARQEVPFQINYDHTSACHELHGSEELGYSAVFKVVQEEMAHHHVEAACSKGKVKGVRGQLRRRRITHVHNPLIERSDTSIGIPPFQCVAHVP
jgi:hypothetical protein